MRIFVLLLTIITVCSSACSENITEEIGVGWQSTLVPVSEEDGLATFTINISGPVSPNSTTTVYLAVVIGGTADINDYENLTNPITSSAGSNTVSGSVDIINDNMIEDTETIILHIHNCTNTAANCSVLLPYSSISITDNDIGVGWQSSVSVSEEDGLATFAIDISGSVDPDSITTVYLAVIGGTADINDYENLTNPITSSAGSNTVSGSVDIINDNMIEDTETIILRIDNCTNTAANCLVLLPYSLISITDNDVGVSWQSTLVSVSEEDSLATFTINISGSVDPNSTTTVYLFVIGGTADMNDYENLTSPIMSSAGSNTVSGSVDIINDNIIEDSETIFLHIHNCTNTAASCSVLLPYSSINITDNDSLCDSFECPTGSQCKIIELAGQARVYCDPLCDLDNGGCADDETCALEDVVCRTAPCPQRVVCTPITNPCDDFECPTGSECKVYEPTSEAFCTPSCDLDNGGCAVDETCSLEDAICTKSPCPPEIKCIPIKNCPPTCSPEFCSIRRNKFRPCSRPPPLNGSPCPDSCGTTSCMACYYSDAALPAQPRCDNVCKFFPRVSRKLCLIKWMWCIRRQRVKSSGKIFRCYGYPCSS